MANINISDLDASDSEDFLNDLSENGLEIIGGYQVYRCTEPTTVIKPFPSQFPFDPYPNPTANQFS
jgi:hypothetical protein